MADPLARAMRAHPRHRHQRAQKGEITRIWNVGSELNRQMTAARDQHIGARAARHDGRKSYRSAENTSQIHYHRLPAAPRITSGIVARELCARKHPDWLVAGAQRWPCSAAPQGRPLRWRLTKAHETQAWSRGTLLAQAAAALAGRRGVLHGVARHHHPQHRRSRDRRSAPRGAAQHEVGARQLHAEPRRLHPDQRLDGRPLRHAPRLRRRPSASSPSARCCAASRATSTCWSPAASCRAAAAP